MFAKLLIVLLVSFCGISYGQDIFTAVRSGDLQQIRALHEIDPDTIEVTNSMGFKPLMIACYRNKTEAAKLLVELGADVNAVSPEGTALMGAAYQGNAGLAKFLLEHHADCNVQGPDGNSALMYAVLNQNEELVKVVLAGNCNLQLKNKDGQTAYSLAQALENKKIERLVERKMKEG